MKLVSIGSTIQLHITITNKLILLPLNSILCQIMFCGTFFMPGYSYILSYNIIAGIGTDVCIVAGAVVIIIVFAVVAIVVLLLLLLLWLLWLLWLFCCCSTYLINIMITMTMTTPNSTAISNPTTTPITPPPPPPSPIE